MDCKKIVVVGAGYVGMSLSALLARQNHVELAEIVPAKIDMINRGVSPIRDRELEEALASGELDLTAVPPDNAGFTDADFIIVSTPTDYDPEKNRFNTVSIEETVKRVAESGSSAYIVIKSTIPIGYTAGLRKTSGYSRIMFSPEFLRESRALYDNLYPSRIIVGTDLSDTEMTEAARTFASLLESAALKENVPVMIMGSSEAESVKLFANTYLAMRVAYFNELDSFAEEKGLSSKSIIEGVCADPRIGDNYNNPSFGYGGYCLPKDTKQLRAGFEGIREDMISAIVESNDLRMDHVADHIMAAAERLCADTKPVIGAFRLAMKTGSDNYRASSTIAVIERLVKAGAKVIIYEPSLDDGIEFEGGTVVNDLAAFKDRADIIMANRADPLLDDAADRLYTRDLFRRD